MKKFEWRTRYSETDEPDKQGRWARLCYYNGLLIAWVSRVNDVKFSYPYTITDYFPSMQNDISCYVGNEKDFETAKQGVEKRFTEFLSKVNQSKPDDYIFNTYIPALVKYVVKRDKPTTEKEFVEFAQALYGQVKKEESIKHSA